MVATHNIKQYLFHFFFADNAESQGALNSNIRRSGSDRPRSFSRQLLRLVSDALCGLCCNLRGIRTRNKCAMKFCINPKTCDFILTRQLTRSWTNSNSTSDLINNTTEFSVLCSLSDDSWITNKSSPIDLFFWMIRYH